MARKPTGEVLERRRGATVVYAIRFRAYGKRRYLTLGTSAGGWTRARAEPPSGGGTGHRTPAPGVDTLLSKQ